MQTIGKLTWRLALVPSAIALALVAGLYVATAWPLSAHLRQLAEMRVSQDAEVLARRVESAAGRRVSEMRQLGRALERVPLSDTARLRAELAWLKAHSSAFAWIGVTAPDGRVIAATEDWLLNLSLQGRPVFERGREGVWFGEFHPAKLLQPMLAGSDREQVWVADVGLPLLPGGAGSAPTGVLVAHLNAQWVQQMGDAVIGDERRRSLAMDWSLVQPDGHRLSERSGPVDPRQLPASAPQGLIELPGTSGGHPHMVAFRTVNPGVNEALRWRVLVAQDLDVAMAPVTRLYGVLGGVALLSLVLGLGLAVWTSRRLTRPYAGLLEAVDRRFEAEGDGSSVGQFMRRLGEELSTAQPLQESRAGALLHRLAHNAQQMERMLDHLPMGVLLCDAEQRVVYANATFAALSGQATPTLHGRAALDVLLGEDDPLRATLQQAQAPASMQFDLRCADGRRRPVAWQRVVLFGRARQPDSVLMLVQDLSGEVSERRRADALQRRFALLVNTASRDGFVLMDAGGRVTDWSQGAAQLSGWDAEAVLGRPLRSLFVDPEGADAALAAAALDGQANLALRMRRATQGDFHAEGRCYALNDGQGGMALMFSDTTQTREASARLTESESRLAAIIAGASDAIISTDAQGQVLLFNPAAERIFGVARDEMLGQTLARLLPEGEFERHGQRMAAFATSETTRRPMGVGKVQGRRSDGETLVLEAAISAAQTGGRAVLTAVLRDVSERDRAERRMVEYQLQLTELSQRLLAQEKETTRRLAQSLHDELGQTLAGLRLLLDAALLRGGEVPAWVRRLDDTVNLANRQVRQVLVELRPPLLDEQGLREALANELAQQAARHGDGAPALRLDWLADDAQRWPADTEYAAFMVAREGLGNALRHAQARQVDLRVEGDGSWLRLSVEDDGVGTAEAESKPGHLGLVGMRERALAIGAQLGFEASPGGGLRVHLSWREPTP